MKKQKVKFLLSALFLTAAISPLFAQTSKRQAIFAVLNGGKSLEPIVLVENGKLLENEGGEDGSWADFVKTYYKPKTTYDLIFGGSPTGKVTINKADAKAECSANIAEISAQSSKAKLGGMVMALATNAPNKKTDGLRRAPTAAERAEIENLVRAEFTKQKNSAAVLKTMRSHNLTALDADGDKSAEFVGSYWVSPTKTSRGKLFFIAEKGKNGKYVFSYREYELVGANDIMSGEITALDEGLIHELLLDTFDTDGDGTSEIFTVVQAFEGNNFNIYRRQAGKWTRALETYNYHCAY